MSLNEKLTGIINQAIKDGISPKVIHAAFTEVYADWVEDYIDSLEEGTE